MLQCYKCDGVKGQDLPCDGASGKGKEVCTLNTPAHQLTLTSQGGL